MKILIIDGQGGKIGCLLCESIKNHLPTATIIAVGTNSIATAAMLKSGADFGATGENPVVVNSVDADFICGPIGIIESNALLGELTPKMAEAIGSSKAKKLLIPFNRCQIKVLGAPDLPLSEYVKLCVSEIKAGI